MGNSYFKQKFMKKNKPKYTDPPRFPRVINKYEGIALNKFDAILAVTVKEIGKIMDKK